MEVNNPIRIGYSWTQDVQPVTVYDGVDAQRQQIASSDTSNPCKVVTKYPHGLSAGKICIDGHAPNVIVNGNHSFLVVDATTISLTGVIGQITGGGSGVLQNVEDASTYTSFVITARPNTIESALAHPVITLTWIDQTIFSFTLKITAAESAQITWQQEPLLIRVSWTTPTGNDSIDLYVDIVNV